MIGPGCFGSVLGVGDVVDGGGLVDNELAEEQFFVAAAFAE